MIVGAERDVGAEALGQQLAALAMMRGIGPILVVGCGPQRGARKPGLLEQADSQKPLGGAMWRMDETPHVLQATLAGDPMRLRTMSASDCRLLVEEFRRSFALTIMLGSGEPDEADFMMMSRDMDGAIIVIAAERTRAGPVSAIARRIRAHGGQILGSVMTKQTKQKSLWPFN